MLIDAGRPIADAWTVLSEDGAGPVSGPVIVPYPMLASWTGDVPLGVTLTPETAVETLADHLSRLSLVRLVLPIFRDGRAFTQARALREYLKFRGVIRIGGHVLPDQYAFLLRCGADVVEVPDGTDLAPWRAALHRFPFAYQSEIGDADAGVRKADRIQA